MTTARDSTMTLEQVKGWHENHRKGCEIAGNAKGEAFHRSCIGVIDAHLATRNAVVSVDSGDVVDAVSKAMRRAWSLGQLYFQQADSEYWSQNKKSDETQGKFIALVDETRAAIESLTSRKVAVPDGWMLVPIEPTEAMVYAGASSHDYPSVFMGGPSEQGKRMSKRIYKAMLACAPEAMLASQDEVK